MLDSNQLSHLDETKREINDKTILIKTAIDIQALLRLLIEKDIISKNEIDTKRKEVSSSPKYAGALQYIQEAEEEIQKYSADPQSLLKELFNRKLNNK